MVSVLITGGAGFLGCHLASSLAATGSDVTILDNLFRTGGVDSRLKEILALPRVKFVKSDLSDPASWTNLSGDFDYVYHFAGINGTKFFYEIPYEVMRVNLTSTMNLLEWLRRGFSGKLILASTSELYAQAVDAGIAPLPTPEDSPVLFSDRGNPRWSYASSKLTNELLTTYLSRLVSFKFSIVRYHNVYGPRMGHQHVVPEIFGRLKENGRRIDVHGADNTRSFCFVEDAILATTRVAESNVTDGEVINIGNDQEEISIENLVRMIAHIMGLAPELKKLPAPPGSVSRRVPALGKLRRLTGFNPSVSLESGLRRTIDSYEKE